MYFVPAKPVDYFEFLRCGKQLFPCECYVPLLVCIYRYDKHKMVSKKSSSNRITHLRVNLWTNSERKDVHMRMSKIVSGKEKQRECPFGGDRVTNPCCKCRQNNQLTILCTIKLRLPYQVQETRLSSGVRR